MKTIAKVFVILSILFVVSGCEDLELSGLTAEKPQIAAETAQPKAAETKAAKVEPYRVTLEVSPLRMDCVNFPVRARIRLPDGYARMPEEQISVTLKQRGSGTRVPGQIVKSRRGAQLWWIIPKAGAGEATRWVATVSTNGKAKKSFSWQDTEGDHLDLLYNGRKVTRYVYAHDGSTRESFRRTAKPFHHVFDETGKNLLTNGTDADVLYPHHRGIFVGWQKTQFKGKRYNFWAMSVGRRTGTVQKHQRFLGMTAGPVLAKSNTLVHWNAPDGETVIEERRQVTAFRQANPTVTLLEVRTNLKAVNGDVYFGGDRTGGPEHNGVQYRAHGDVNTGPAEGKAVYTFPTEDAVAETDENIPWATLSYWLNNKRYNVQFIDHPRNPDPTYFSAYRDYGRFGPSFHDYTIKAGQTVRLVYYIHITMGLTPERAQMDTTYWSTVNSPTAKVVR